MEPRFKIWEVENGTYKLVYEDSEQQQIQLEFLDEDNNVLFAEVINNENGFIQPFDLKSLPVGEYTIKIKSGETTITENIEIKTVSEKYADLISIKKNQDSKQFTLSVGNEVNTDLSMYIMDDAGNTIHQEQLAHGMKLYNVDQILGQSITVVVYSDNGVVKESIVKL
jgi:hypothetical protein